MEGLLYLAVGILAAAGAATGLTTLSGSLGGGLVGISAVAGFSWQGLVFLLIYFPLLTGAATAFRFGEKLSRGLADEVGGRDIFQALANGGIPLLAALLTALGSLPTAWGATLFITCLTSSAADTVSAEVGKVVGRRTYLIWGLRPVPPGTDGGVSLPGTAAGLATIVIMGATGMALFPGLLEADALLAGAVAGNLADSLLGALAQRRLEMVFSRRRANDLVNLLAGIVSGAVALAVTLI